MSELPPPGPRQQRIQSLWDQAWLALKDGGVHEPYAALAESELSSFRRSLPANDVAALDDLSDAEYVNLFQARHMAAHIENLVSFREGVSRSINQAVNQMTSFNEHAVRSLTLANGGVVLATLAYIQSKSHFDQRFLWVIAFGAMGYLLTVLGSYLTVLLTNRIVAVLSELANQRLAESVRNAKLKVVAKRAWTMMVVSHPVFYLSAVCLIASLWVGVTALAR